MSVSSGQSHVYMCYIYYTNCDVIYLTDCLLPYTATVEASWWLFRDMSSVSVSVSASAPPRSESYVVKALLSGSVCAFVAALVNPLDVVKVTLR